jgi:hypothetical protein
MPISEDYILDPDFFNETRSIHLAATYYALATQVIGEDCARIRVALLNKASEALRDVKLPTAQVKAIDAMIQREITK